MNKFKTRLGVSIALFLLCLTVAVADPGTLTIDVSHPGISISPTLYGLMTEEINHSYDGGLYAELIQNRAFADDPVAPVHWSLVGNAEANALSLDTAQPLSAALPVSLHLSAKDAAQGRRVGVANDGYWGLPIMPGTPYRASFYARAAPGFHGSLNIDLESPNGKIVYAHAIVSKTTGAWQHYSTVLTTGKVAPTTAARFVISTERPGSLWLGLVSLFPPTYDYHPNGLRIDLMQKMAAMRPTFLRLPGGNYLQGNTLVTRFDWKKTLGPLKDRPGHPGPWGYRSTDGLGLLEFLEWCESLHCQPLLAVFAGYTLNHQHVEAGQELTPYVQDALDEIEYVTGSVSTKWGARRAADGHPAPFPLRYVEVGNEDWIDRSGSYEDRFPQFYDALKATYPHLQIIATMQVKSRVPDLVDDHFYNTVANTERDAGHYDHYDRAGPKIFVGEWAAQDVPTPWVDVDHKGPTPSMNCALADAAWMIGLERNADVVVMQCYAPLFVNVNPGARQWAVNLIGYDALSSFGSPSYYAQRMFANNKGDVVLPTNVKSSSATTDVFALATRDLASGDVILKFVNVSADPAVYTIDLHGVKTVKSRAVLTQLRGDPNDVNSLAAPKKVAPTTIPLKNAAAHFQVTFAAHSVNVLRMSVNAK